VIHAGGTPLEQGSDQHDTMLAGGRSQFLATRTRNRLCEIEKSVILSLTKILRLEKFRQANDLRAPARGVRHAAQSLFQILFGLRAARHLHQRYAEFFRRQGFPSSKRSI
jgi:hypothetical protein